MSSFSKSEHLRRNGSDKSSKHKAHAIYCTDKATKNFPSFHGVTLANNVLSNYQMDGVFLNMFKYMSRNGLIQSNRYYNDTKKMVVDCGEV